MSDADLRTYGFPPGYFIIKNVATGRLLDVESDLIEDGTPLILWPETETSLVEDMRKPESNNQVFFIDTSGALCSRSSGHAIDVESDRPVLRHRRPVSHPFPNAYSHPPPRFSYDPATQLITVAFVFDPSYPSSGDREAALSIWRDKTYLLTSIPLRKPRTLIDDASELLTSALSVPFSLFGHTAPTSPRPDQVFDSGDIDLREDEILEQERSEEGEVDDSPEKWRQVRVIGIAKEDGQIAGEEAKKRRQWIVVPLRAHKTRTAASVEIAR
ncbi:uncharacterized protein PHACADRAFT_85198 [Phanerochaete carnosa HHB-10118-sp]|uniref:Uncharacterized protein n=1 Tax=Phanerochaete carnosa (strain HHB-10118-sp) TaxID=650164 RepID=K5WPI9_PHACS|nr:uncharacterized protein PHACADRAFT_85198 [Phanerochaete carnosa HHB-10118-sp]EKM61355.1 hypothetical protein PHACADRAFT_85198 [Phanerochaete carnosa HHB-10118-sp]